MVLPTGGGEDKTTENMKDLYASVQSWVTEEEDYIPLIFWKGVDE